MVNSFPPQLGARLATVSLDDNKTICRLSPSGAENSVSSVWHVWLWESVVPENRAEIPDNSCNRDGLGRKSIHVSGWIRPDPRAHLSFVWHRRSGSSKYEYGRGYMCILIEFDSFGILVGIESLRPRPKLSPRPAWQARQAMAEGWYQKSWHTKKDFSFNT